MRGIAAGSAVVLMLTEAIAAGGDTRPDCARPQVVSFSATAVPLRSILKNLANQSGLDIAVDPALNGFVTAQVECADLRDALREILPQVNAEFCETDGVIRVKRQGSGACGRIASPVLRVAPAGRPQ